MEFNVQEYQKQYRLKNKEKIAAQRSEHWAKKETKAHRKAYNEANKEILRQKRKAFALANPEHVKAMNKKHRDNRIEKSRADYRKYRAENLERERQRGRKYKADNEEKCRASRAITYAKADPKKRRAYAAARRKANPELFRDYGRKRRALKKNAPVGDRKIIMKWERGWKKKKVVTCYWCQAEFPPKKCHTDHIISFKLGGAHSIENLCISCQPCNHKKNAKPLSVWNSKIEQPVLL